MKGLFLIPTRRRHAKLGLLLEQIDATRLADSQFLVILDNDDDPGGLRALPPWVTVTSGPRMWLTPKINAHAVSATRAYGAVGWLADDSWPETPGWDALLLDALKEPGIAWPDSNRRPGFPEHQLISSCIVRALGWYFEPSLRHYYTDNVWADLAAATGCGRYVKDAMVRHDHYEVTGAARDETYRQAEVNGPVDRDLYLLWRKTRFAADARTVTRAIAQSYETA